MGTIKVKGYAERKVEADSVCFTITFLSKDIKASSAAEEVKKQCEVFLKEINASGIPAKQIHLEEDDISNVSDYNDGGKLMIAKRILSFNTVFDAAFNNRILKIISENDINAYLDTESYISNKKEIHEELLKEAVKDSRRKAELIAMANDQKVKYIDSVEDDRYMDEDDDSPSFLNMISPAGESLLSDELRGKELTETEEIYIKWVIE